MNNEWVQKFIDLLSANDITNAQNLKFQHLPKSLFKYREFDANGFAVKNFQDNSLWLSTADQFNDPYDSFFMLNEEVLAAAVWEKSRERLKAFLATKEKPILTPDEVDKFESFNALKECVFQKGDVSPGLIEALDQAWAGLWNDFRVNRFRLKIQKGMGVCSLSEINTSTVMWRYYGGNHSGFCIEYDLIATKSIDSQLIHMVYPVFYVEDMPDLTKRFVWGNPIISAVATLHKSIEWSYEKEWRFIFPLGKSVSFNIRAPKVKAVYLGMNINPENKELMINLAQQKGVPIYEMCLLPHSYKLGIREVSIAQKMIQV